MSESVMEWARVTMFAVLLGAVGAIFGILGYKYFAGTVAPAARADNQTLAQVQQQLIGFDKRLAEVESRRKTESAKVPDVKTLETDIPSPASIPRPARAQYRVTPESAVQSQPLGAQPSPLDPASAQKLANLQQGIGALQQETASNGEAWQASTNRLAELAGELGAQHGQIIRNQDELNRFLGRTEHTTLTFELRRGSTPESVGPVRISLKTSNQKNQRYTLCVYLKDSCVQVRDRGLFEVVQLAVSRDTAPFELIATKVEKDGIVGFLQFQRQNPGH